MPIAVTRQIRRTRTTVGLRENISLSAAPTARCGGANTTANTRSNCEFPWSKRRRKRNRDSRRGGGRSRSAATPRDQSSCNRKSPTRRFKAFGAVPLNPVRTILEYMKFRIRQCLNQEQRALQCGPVVVRSPQDESLRSDAMQLIGNRPRPWHFPAFYHRVEPRSDAHLKALPHEVVGDQLLTEQSALRKFAHVFKTRLEAAQHLGVGPLRSVERRWNRAAQVCCWK